jgi:hypothetical protein
MIGGAMGLQALAGVSPERLLAVGRATHDRLASRSTQKQSMLVLDEHQNRTVTMLAEHIIPETDTPGATAARVNEFIDLLLAEWYEEDERAQFLRGLADVDTRSVSLFGTVFVHATESQRIALLTGMDAELTALRKADAEPEAHFFGQMKWLTLYGYYTSEIGQTQELQAAIIPGRYDPCGPLHRDTPGEW